MLRAANWGVDAENWEFARRRMFDEATDVKALHEWTLRLLDSWPNAQGSKPYPLVAMDRTLRNWPRIRELLSDSDEVLQVDLVGELQLTGEDAEALRYAMYVLSRCGVISRRTLKNRVRLQFRGENIDPTVLRAHWRDAWACPRASFDLARPMYAGLDPEDHGAFANLLSFDGRDVFTKAASQKAVEELNRVEAELRLKMKAADGDESRVRRRVRVWRELDRGTQELLLVLDGLGSFEDE